jgi:drug/metabolite transporter (DMT)-like permease
MAPVVLAVLSTIAYASAALYQRSAAMAEARFVRQLRRPSWWCAVGLLAAGGSLHVAALRFGSLTVVQPLGALTLVFAVPLGAWAERRAVTRTEGLGAAAAVLGLATLLALIRPTGAAHFLAGPTIGFITAVTLGLLTAIWLTSRVSGWAQGVSLAFAAGVSSALASSLTQVLLVTGRWQQAIPTLAAMAVFIPLGMLFSQLSYRRSLSAPLATATITNPVVAAVFAVLVLHERPTGGPTQTFVGLLAATVASAGIVLLARSPAAAMAH